MTRTIFIVAALALAVTLPITPAQAQVSRTFVSAAGSDSNNCANVMTPCRHLANAYAVTAANGEIFVLDPANYGSVTITHGVSIQGHGWASIAPPNNGNGITINAGPNDTIAIHGVAIDGTGATGGINGIVFNSGGDLIVTDCVVQNFANSGTAFTGNGILIAPSSGTINFLITNSTFTNNSTAGISYEGPNRAAVNTIGNIDHVVVNDNFNSGINIDTQFATTGTATIALSNSVISGNQAVGIFVGSTTAALDVTLDNLNINNNGNGIQGYNAAKLLLSRSVITGNASFGVDNDTNPNAFFTYKDNKINFNGNSNTVEGSALIALTPQ